MILSRHTLGTVHQRAAVFVHRQTSAVPRCVSQAHRRGASRGQSRAKGVLSVVRCRAPAVATQRRARWPAGPPAPIHLGDGVYALRRV